MSVTQSYIGSLVIENCCNCGMTYGMQADFQRRKLDDHTTFYCPKGHPQCYTGPTEAQKLKKELEQANKVISFKDERINGLHDKLTDQKNKTKAEKAAKTRLKNRVKNGVCPCCNRTVGQLADHMKTMHPEYVEANAVNPIHDKINSKVS